MQTVVIFGAGKSSACLIEYMLIHAGQQWRVIVADANLSAITEKLKGSPKGEAVVLDIFDEVKRKQLVNRASIVISILPPALHNLVAQDCLEFKKNLITSSYVSDEIRAMDAAAKEAGVLFMCEMGLDPGIDHMSACHLIHGIERIAGSITSFKSYCGGLVAPESDDNPWHYKISWNPRNIVRAGAAGAQWLENGKTMHMTYEELYSVNKKIKVSIDHIGNLGYYPNRDSMKYLDLYHLPDIKTFMRATLRHPNFMKGWDLVVKLGLTDEQDSFVAQDSTYTDWLCSKSGLTYDNNLRQNFIERFKADDKTMRQFEYLGLFDNRKIFENKTYTSADLLQMLLEEKWKLSLADKDMVVMQHQVEYLRKDKTHKVTCTMVVKGENQSKSAMAMTVGLPMAMLARKILNNDTSICKLKGVHIPVMPEIYVPLLKELKKNNIEFIEEIN